MMACGDRRIDARHRVKLAEPTVSPSTGLPAPPRIKGVRVATWNIHPLVKKYLAVADTIFANNIDLLVVTESWHRSLADAAIRRSSPPGFNFIDRPRPGALDDPPGGGLVIYHRDTLSAKRISISSPPTTFEALAVTVSTCRGPLVVLAVYRPGSSQPTRAFFDEFAIILEQFALYNSQIIVTGDLNLPLKDLTSPAAADFQAIADQFGLTQHVAEPTHRLGGWLDVIITRDDCALTDLQIFPPTISDHGLVMATIPNPMTLPPPLRG